MMSSKRGKPSLQATVVGLGRAQQIFKQRGLTRQRMAQELGIDRSVVGKFLRGDKVWSQKFEAICGFLGLPWQEIAEGMGQSVDILQSDVHSARNLVRDYIIQRCGTLRIPGMAEVRNVESVYTQLQVLPGSGVYPLEAGPNLKKRGQSLSGEQVVLDHAHVYVLGLPGSGKTTLLKYLAMRCIQGTFKPELVPIFIALRDMGQLLKQHDLVTCISMVYGKICGLDSILLQTLFDAGNILLLLDGEDEIPAALAKEIALTSFHLFYKNRVVITCRTATSQGGHEQFIRATIQPFTDNQVADFSRNWFQANPEQGGAFMAWLASIKADARKSFDLVGTPLLLALLCIVFERQGDIPKLRSQIYEKAFTSILSDVNSSHIIPADAIIADKTYQEKITLLKSMARLAFDYEQKVFPASAEFLDQAGVGLEMRGGLSANDFCRQLEATYGLITQDGWSSYRFTHLSFHEYFVALSWLDEIATDADFVDLLDDAHLFNPDWYEVFLFFVEMLPLERAKAFLQALKARLVTYLEQQSPIAVEQIAMGRGIATHIIDLYKTHADSPPRAQNVLIPGSTEAAMIISAFCADYHYRFDPARRISRVLDVDYRFNHDLVLAHCFKCNLNEDVKQSLKVGSHYDFADALSHVWGLADLHQQNQAVDTVDDVRALFLDYVLMHPDKFSAACVQTLKSQQKNISQLSQLSQQAAISEKSRLVAEISNPAQEDHPFLGSAEYRFPTHVYDRPDIVMVLGKYYHGCTLLCDCLSPELDEEFRQEILHQLFA